MEDSAFKSVFGEEIYLIPTPVTILTDQAWNEIREEERTLLSKILQAVRLSIDGVRILQMSTFDLSSLGEKPARVIAFLNPPKGLKSFEVVQTEETSVIFSDPLSSLMTDDAAKRKLWGALKGMFEA